MPPRLAIRAGALCLLGALLPVGVLGAVAAAGNHKVDSGKATLTYDSGFHNRLSQAHVTLTPKKPAKSASIAPGGVIFPASGGTLTSSNGSLTGNISFSGALRISQARGSSFNISKAHFTITGSNSGALRGFALHTIAETIASASFSTPPKATLKPGATVTIPRATLALTSVSAQELDGEFGTHFSAGTVLGTARLTVKVK
ncbi:MAG TPA: hypothetical protein VGY97_03745 [Solirubrobacteraceae bacterium]|nr:hypothetical protein [Solirubrobacteraceae bacterium]